MDWRQDPLNSVEPTKVARRVMQEKFRDSGVYRWRNDWWVWREQRWAVLDDERLKDLIWVCLEDAVWEKPTRNGVALERYSPDKQKIDGVARALEALVRIDAEVVPCWIGKPLGDFSPHTTIAFADMLFNAETGKTMQRPKNWFDPAVLPVNFSEEFACPRWEQAVKEWGDGDPVWAELLSRWMGYCLLGTRRYARWMLMYGKIRGGKGTITTIMRKLIGRAAFMSSSLEDLSGEFGMDGLERSKVLAINEVNEVDSKAGERVCRVLKNIVGQDPLTVNVKHQRQQRNVIVNAAPMLQSNEIPVLPNKGRGLSGKMLVLPFEVSFEGKEDLYLEDKLEAEMQGIAMWAARGAQRLLGSEINERWPIPAAAQDAVRLYHLQNNPFDSFLHARFVQRKDGFVANEVLREQWDDWLESNRIRLHVPANMLFVRICQESSWGLRQTRLPESQGHERGIVGLSLSRTQHDEH
jgi:P4 family phage/plasmid primase-like protien